MAKPTKPRPASPVLKVVQWPIGKLKDYAQNPRKNDPQVERMMAAITEFGFRIPVVARSDGEVVDGHLRLKAARKLGIKTIPVALADNLSDAQVKAFRILANQSANWAEWDNDLLRIEFAELQALDFDLGKVGFTPAELSRITEIKPLGDATPQLDGMTFSIVIRCSDETHQGELLEQLENQGLKCEALIS